MPRAAARPYRRAIRRLLGLALAAALLAPAGAARADTPPALVQDLLPGASSGGPHDLAAFKGSVYFSGADAGGFGLWRSDGNGIASLLRTDTGAGFTVAGDTLYFAASDGAHGVELWKSDGTAPALVKDLEPGTGGSGPRSLAAVGTTLYFNAFTTVGGWQLWRTDGGDPVALHAFGTQPLRSLTAVGSLLFFVSANELWRSDGTPAGTVKVAGAGAAPSSLTAFAGKLYFAAVDDAHGNELWRADATGATLVKDIWTGQDSSSPRYPAVLGGTLYFAAEDARGRELWRYDGADATLVADIDPGSSDPRWITTVGANLIFEAHDPAHGRALWRSDGTGASLLADINPTGDASIASSGDLPPGAPERLAVAGGSAFFQADDGTTGIELWRSDGTTPARVADINPGANGSQPEGMVQAGSRLFFSAPRPDTGTELWSFVLGAAADVSVSVSAAPDRPRVGEQTTLTVTARNNGPQDTTGVNVGVTLPGGVTLDSSGPGFAAGEWAVGALASGESKTLALVVTVTGPSPTVTARVLASGLPDQTPANDVASVVLAPPQIVVGGGCNLVSAIVAANTDAPAGTCPAGRGADTIVLSAGSTQGLAASYENADGATGLPSITSDITILGNGATIAPSAGAPAFRLFRVAADGVLALRDLRVRGGSAAVRGGAILVAGGRLSMENATVEDSISPNGGGIAALNGTVSLRLVTVRNNTATFGGGLYAEGGSLDLTDVVVSGNRATHPTIITFGGGIYTTAALTLTRGVITGNSAFDGGGVVSSGPSTLTGVTISGNIAAGGFGGIDNRGVMTLTGGFVSSNTAGGVGGGIGNQFSGAGSLRVTGTSITGNKGTEGGGIENYGPLAIDGSLVSGNIGGGLYNLGAASITSSTFSGNAIANSGGLTVVAATIVGGGISGAGTSTVTGSIVSGCAGAVVDGGGNVGCFSAVDPKLGPLADNGGPTLTHMPLPGSPAVDAGAATCPAVDQRGAARPLGRCDAGAVEAGAAPVVVAAKITPKITGLPKKLVASGVSVVLGTASNPPTASTSQTLTRVGGAAAVIGRGTTRIPAGGKKRITVKLTKAGKRLLRKPVKVRVRIVATSPDGTKATITKTLKLTRRR